MKLDLPMVHTFLTFINYQSLDLKYSVHVPLPISNILEISCEYVNAPEFLPSI